jgi:hypothetical protein
VGVGVDGSAALAVRVGVAAGRGDVV